MSVSELFDHGEPHPWANLRVNNLTVDGTFDNGDIGSFSITLSGPIPTPTTFICDFVKISRTATLMFNTMTVSTAGGVAGPFTAPPGTFPIELLPDFTTQTEFDFPVRVINAGINPTTTGLLIFRATGEIDIFLDLSGANFGTVGQRGMYATSVTYRTAI